MKKTLTNYVLKPFNSPQKMKYPELNMQELVEKELDKYFPKKYISFEDVKIKVKKVKGKRLTFESVGISGPSINLQKLVDEEMKKLDKKGVFPKYPSDEYGEIKGIVVFDQNKCKNIVNSPKKTKDNSTFYERFTRAKIKYNKKRINFFKNSSIPFNYPSKNSYRNGCSTQLKSIYNH